MFFGDTVQDTRQLFFSSWHKFMHHQPLNALEEELVAVIKMHPEYHAVLEKPELYQEHQYFPELGDVNPFLHMGLHLAIREQIKTNRPAGIDKAYQALLAKLGDPMEVEHQFMEQLAEFLWMAQKNQTMPDEQAYLQRLNQLSGTSS